jgi:NAD(P)-dependent dehydrogenase (short-subunit alcohol dehydrogenase family)
MASGRIVVITGASSGIGRATARAFAGTGAGLVLCARAGERLEEVEAECAQAGARVVAVEADVSRPEDVVLLAQRAIEVFGGFDVWVNNAGVIAFGRIDETPAEDHEQVIRTNLCGCLFGAREAVRHFRARGRGIVIDVSSLVSHLGQSLSTAYTASKWGVNGLGQALRAELADASGIHVCTVMPAYIDTPLFEHGANYTGHEAKPVSPVYPPERVAQAIVGLVDRPQAEIMVGDVGRVLAASHAVMPELTNRMMAGQIESWQFTDRPRGPSSGNLHLAGGDTAVAGGWQERVAVHGDTFDTALRGLALGTLVVAGAVAAAGLWRARH